MAYISSRLILTGVSLLFMTLLVFGLVRLTGDPLAASLPLEATARDRQEMASRLGFDRPLITQYGVFLAGLASGDLGISVQYRPKTVISLIQERWIATFQLALAGNSLALAVAIPMGVWAARQHGRFGDAMVRLIALVGQSVPVFVVGLLLIAIFAGGPGWLPTSGRTSWQSFVLPAATIAIVVMPGIVRVLRSSMIEALNSDYVAYGRAQGLEESVLVWKYALRNAGIPLAALASLIFLNSLAGAVVTETVFAWPGVGRLAVQAVASRDFPVVQGVVLVFTAVYLIGNLLSDLLYGYLDPRVRYGGGPT